MAFGTAQTWTVNGAAPLTVGGVISDATGSGSTGLTLAGARHRDPQPPTPTPAARPSTRATLQLGDGVSNNGSVTGNIADNGLLAFANPRAHSR